MSDDNIASVLGMNPMPEPDRESTAVTVVEVVETDSSLQSLNDDVTTARDNIQDLLSKGADAFQELITVAKQSQSPRAYEVLSTFMKNLVDANHSLVELHTQSSKAKTAVQEADPNAVSEPGVVNNNLFVGSTAELQKLIGDLKK